MKTTYLTLTFRESLLYGNLLFEAGETITVIYLGGGDVLRVEYEGVVYELPLGVMSVGWSVKL